jgi:nucleotide-binding universal stress UspA family protein
MLAGCFEAKLYLLHVADATFLRAVVADPGSRDTAVLNRLDDLLTDAEHRRFRVLSAVEHSDAPADEIVRYAHLKDIDLIVMGTHGRTGVSHMLLGSVAETVVRTASCPVLTLHATPKSTAAQLGPARILVPTDFSPPSDRALEYARRMAARCGATLHLLHVLEETVDAARFGSDVFVPDSPAVRAARLREARRKLAHRRGGADHKQPGVSTEVVVGSSTRTIARYAAVNSFDLIVMGTHGRTGFAHLIMGSVAEAVVRTASCPVLSIQHPREEARRSAVTHRRGTTAVEGTM